MKIICRKTAKIKPNYNIFADKLQASSIRKRYLCKEQMLKTKTQRDNRFNDTLNSKSI